MSERDLSGIWFTGERERNISGAFALAVSNWAERTPTKRNIVLTYFNRSLTCSDWHQPTCVVLIEFRHTTSTVLALSCDLQYSFHPTAVLHQLRIRIHRTVRIFTNIFININIFINKNKTIYLLSFWALNIVALLSMEGKSALRFHQKIS